MINTTKELDELPDQAVVYDHNCDVWQKLIGKDRGIAEVVGYVWFQPGDADGYTSSIVELPARLLDDGL
jgi:hypothetical protein